MSKYLCKTTEEHRADTEAEATELINAAKSDSRYILSKYSSVHKERKQKGEIIDDYFIVTLVKVAPVLVNPLAVTSGAVKFLPIIVTGNTFPA